MKIGKVQMCLGVIASVAVLGVSVTRADIRDTIQNATSGTTVQCSGSYTVSPMKVPAGVTVKGPATFTFNDSTRDGFTMKGANATLQSLTIKGANRAANIYASGCKVVNCTATGNHDTAINCDGASSATISGCTAYGNADPGGGNADGFGVKSASGSGISFSSCISYNNSDDGFDFYEATAPVTVSGCQAYSNGSYNGAQGNGDGFKMGGQYNVAHTYSSCTAHNNTAGSTARGFDTNHNTAAIKLTSCHSYSNKNKDVLGNCVLSNCTMQQ
ncbi:MAG TPA: right-handed parallel beta-helix repeat-containing protein [Verrucomicrobiae bacterium]|nr:right-handed parallel beta-helix repeat-containing protein [Verrucomicrobiae bacterium]